MAQMPPCALIAATTAVWYFWRSRTFTLPPRASLKSKSWGCVCMTVSMAWLTWSRRREPIWGHWLWRSGMAASGQRKACGVAAATGVGVGAGVAGALGAGGVEPLQALAPMKPARSEARTRRWVTGLKVLLGFSVNRNAGPMVGAHYGGTSHSRQELTHCHLGV